jgi:DNA-binding PadR family transcriptional regulator
MSPRQQAPLSLEYILLGLVSNGPIHGYDLHRQLGSLDGLSSIWHVKQSQLYALLDKLELMGFLQASSVPGSVYAPRKQYQLTESGQAAFENWITSPVLHARDMRQDFLARLYFARQAGVSTVAQLLAAQMEQCRQWQSGIRAALDQTPDPLRFQRIVDAYRLNQIDAMLDWLEQCRAMLLP